MRHSDDRILVTHVGSLPRPSELLDLLLAREQGREYDAQRLDELQARGVSEIVRRQLELGIDIVNDGELGKTSFLSYVNTRLGGMEPRAPRGSATWATSREAEAFPEYYAWAAEASPSGAATALRLAATGPVTYTGAQALATDIRHLQAAIAEHSSVMIEHPDTVADRIVRYAEIVGRERILPGADCGFASFAATVEFMPEIVWAKLEALAEGSRRASERLWG